MDFEILHLPEMPASPFEAMRRYLSNPRRMMQAWGEKAPNMTGLLVFLLVVVELVVTKRIVAGEGTGPAAIPDAFLFGSVLLGGQLLLLFAAGSVANVMEKRGHPVAALCYMNLGLSPLLLALPITLFTEAMGWSDAIRVLAMLALILRVAANWRESIQFSFRLTRLQTVVAFYGAGSAALAGALFLLYVAAFGRLAAFLNV